MNRNRALQLALQFISKGVDKAAPFELAVGLSALSQLPQAAEVCATISQRLLKLRPLKKGTLTDAFAAANALEDYQSGAVSGKDLAHLVKRLITAESTPGGPYKSENGKCDVVTNALINSYLQKIAQPLPNVTAFVHHHPLNDTGFTQPFCEYITGRRALHQPLAAQLPSGAWPPLAYSFRASSEWLATALALQQHFIPPPVAQLQSAKPVFGLVRGHLDKFPQSLHKVCQEILTRIHAADRNHEISLLSHYFNKAMSVPVAPRASLKLGAANVFCWMAYMVFDDFLDGEGQTHQLPAAVACYQQALALYLDACKQSPAATRLVRDMFVGMDAANYWEVSLCRAPISGDKIILPDTLPAYGAYQQLAQRSQAHMLGPLILAARSGNHKAQALAHEAFCHYLIARQLNDDILDWQDDLRAGRLSAVVVLLLREAKIETGEQRLDELIGTLQHIFWRRGLQKTCQLTLKHITQAQKLLIKSKLIKPGSEFEDFFKAIEASTNSALEQHARSKLFLQSFTKQ